MSTKKTTIGGQAIIEGIVMKGPKKTCTVVRKPGGEPSDEPLLDLLFSKDEDTIQKLRQLYVHAGLFLEARRQATFWRQARKGGKKGGQGKDQPAAEGEVQATPPAQEG